MWTPNQYYQKLCPYKYKYELVHYLVRYQGWIYSHAMKLRKSNLYAIWYEKNKDKKL